MLIAAFDFGTTGCKGSFFSNQGNLVATHYEPYQTYYPQPGWVIQRPSEWKNALIETVASLLARTGEDASQIGCLTFSGHMNGCVPVDATGEPLRDEAMLWADARAAASAEQLPSGLTWEEFYRKTGAGLDLYLYPALKIAWLKGHDRPLYSRASFFLGTKDVVTSWLTGICATDYSDASNTGLFNISRRLWDSDLVRAFAIDGPKLPDILPSTQVLGGLSPAAARLLHLQQGTPVAVGGGDVVCASAGAGAIAPGVAYACLGSAAWVSTVRSEPILDPSLRVVNLCHLVPGLYSTQLISYTAGIAYKWLRDILCIHHTRAHGEYLSFREMDQMAEGAPPGSGGVLFLPYLRPGGAPHYDMSARAAFVGLNVTTCLSDIFRSVLEGVAFNLRQLVEALERSENNPFPELTLIGGGASGDLWNRIIASVLNRRIVTLTAQQEANTVGAAIAGGIAVEALEDFTDVARFIEVASRVFPRPETAEVYDRFFRVFTEALPSLEDTNRALGGAVRTTHDMSVIEESDYGRNVHGCL